METNPDVLDRDIERAKEKADFESEKANDSGENGKPASFVSRLRKRFAPPKNWSSRTGEPRRKKNADREMLSASRRNRNTSPDSGRLTRSS